MSEVGEVVMQGADAGMKGSWAWRRRRGCIGKSETKRRGALDVAQEGHRGQIRYKEDA